MADISETNRLDSSWTEHHSDAVAVPTPSPDTLPPNPANRLQFPPMKESPALVIQDHTMRLWDLPTFTERGELTAVKDARAIASGGGLLVSGDKYGAAKVSVRIWVIHV